MFENDTKIYLKMKIKRLLSIEKIIIKCEKMCYYNYNKKSNDLENSFDEEQIKAKYEDVLKPYIKMDKKIIKFDDI